MQAEGITVEEDSTVQSMWITKGGEYDYPIDVIDDEWKELTSADEMRKVTQIPEEVLNRTSTVELLSLILDYPLLCDLYAFDTIEDGYVHLKTQFNGINVLIGRQDALNTLIEFYEIYSIPQERVLDYDNLLDGENDVEQLNAMMQDDYYRALILQDGQVLETIDMLEMLIKDVLENNGSISDKKIFAEMYNQKLEEKINSDYYHEVNPTELLNVLIRSNSELVENFNIEAVAQLDQSISTAYVYTPSGNRVSVRYSSEFEFDDISHWTSLIETYNATLITSAQSTFNCHSYAWLSKLYPNAYLHMWLNDAGTFANDSAYTRLNRNTAVSGTIVYYPVNAHSAVATGQRGCNQYGGMELYVVSKWGSGPMVKHLESGCPYYQNRENEYYYLEED